MKNIIYEWLVFVIIGLICLLVCFFWESNHAWGCDRPEKTGCVDYETSDNKSDQNIANGMVRFSDAPPMIFQVKMSDDYSEAEINVSRDICSVSNQKRPRDQKRLRRITITTDDSAYEIDVVCIGENVHLSPKGWVKQ